MSKKNVSKNLNNDLKTSFINELQNNAVLQIGDVISNQYNWNNVTTFKTNGTYLGGIVNSSNGKRMILIKDGNSYHINMFKVDDFVRNNDKSISANIRIYSIDGTMIKSNIIQSNKLLDVFDLSESLNYSINKDLFKYDFMQGESSVTVYSSAKVHTDLGLTTFWNLGILLANQILTIWLFLKWLFMVKMGMVVMEAL